MNSGFALFAHGSVRQKLNRVSSVQFSYVGLYAPLAPIVAYLRAYFFASVAFVAYINEVTLRQVGLVLGWVNACGQVSHFGM